MMIDLGVRNDERGVWLGRDLDGWHEAGVEGGVECRHNDLSAHGTCKGYYLYFRVSNEWAFQGSRPEVWLRVEYYDGPAQQPLHLDYDALGEGLPARYKRVDEIVMTGSGRWRHHTFHLTDAYFGDRENNASDFRLSSTEGATFYINRVWVFLSEPAAGSLPVLETSRACYVPPSAPRLTAPQGGTVVASLAPLASWQGEPHDAYACELEAADGTRSVVSAESVYDHCGLKMLTPGARYRLRVRLHNPRGWGAWSRAVTFTTPARPRDVDWPHLRGYSPHHYGIVSDLAYDYRPVLDRLSGRGINLVRAMPLNAYDVQPFLKAEDGRYDLSRIDPAYLSRLRDFVAYANAKGFIVQFSVFEHCSLRHGHVKDRYALTKGNNIQGVGITADNFASFWSRPESPEMVFCREWAAALTTATQGCNVILEVMNEPYVNTPDNLEFHRCILEALRDAGAEKVSINAWDDHCARELEPLVDYVSWHDNGFVERDAVPVSKVLQSTDTGGWHKKSDVLEWARACAEHGYGFEHMAMSDDGDTGEADTDWVFINALGGMPMERKLP